MFNTIDSLKKLTGLRTYDEIWDAGFDVDDWDVGFQSDFPFTSESEDIDGEEYCISTRADSRWLVDCMASYCVGFTHTKYKGKHYYLVHHA